MLAVSLTCCAVFLALAAHPFVTYPLSLLLMRRHAPLAAADPTAPAQRPSVAICMSAYNEERVIVERIETLLATIERYGPATLHVYADCPSDGTVALLEPYRDRIDLVIGTVRRGKTAGLNQLIDRSASEILLMTDANVVHDADALEKLVTPLHDRSVGLVSARLSYVNPGESATSAIGAIYWSIEEAIKKLESQTVGIIGVDGAMFAIRRDLYRRAPPHLIDDFFVSLNVLIQRCRVLSIDGVTVEERSAVSAREEYRRKMRIACQSVNVHRVLWPQLRRMPFPALYAYFSHRVMKWNTPFALLAAAIAALVALAAVFGWPVALGLLAGGALLLVLGNAVGFHPAALGLTSLMSLAGVGTGVLQSVFTSRTYTVWVPAESVRGAMTSVGMVAVPETDAQAMAESGDKKFGRG